jgi:membrane protease YdiL (CAAX protease family)
MSEWYEKPPVSPAREFLLLVGMWILGLIAGALITMPIWMVMTGQSPFLMEKYLMKPEYRSALLVIQSVSSVFTFFLPALFTAMFVSKKSFAHLGFSSLFNKKSVVLVLLIMTAAVFFGGVLGELNKAIPIGKSLRIYFENMEKQYNEAIRAILLFRNTGDYLISLLVIAVVPAIVEEVLFRGGMQQILIRWFKYPLLGILVASFIFSSIHLSWYGFFPRMALGVVLGYIFFYTGNIWYSILAHFFNNALTVTILYLSFLRDKKIDLESADSTPLWIGLPASVALVFLFKLLFKSEKKRQEQVIENDLQNFNQPV